MTATIEWLGHATFRITRGVTLYIDPWKIQGAPAKADIVLISHDHYDHFVPEDIAKVSTERTVFAGCQELARKLSGDVRTLKPGDRVTEYGVEIRATAAYNIGKEFHPRQKGWLGFLINIEGEIIYYAGDTDVVPDMSKLGRVDVALLPVGGTYTMGPSEAAHAASIINPRRCIPYHYGDIVGSVEDAKRFRNLCTCRTDILPQVE